jgi:hypothetical protein
MAASDWREEHYMRTSTRARNALIGVVSATVLTGGASQTTKMVGVAKTKAQACIEVRNPHGMSAPLCTPFIGH